MFNDGESTAAAQAAATENLSFTVSNESLAPVLPWIL